MRQPQDEDLQGGPVQGRLRPLLAVQDVQGGVADRVTTMTRAVLTTVNSAALVPVSNLRGGKGGRGR